MYDEPHRIWVSTIDSQHFSRHKQPPMPPQHWSGTDARRDDKTDHTQISRRGGLDPNSFSTLRPSNLSWSPKRQPMVEEGRSWSWCSSPTSCRADPQRLGRPWVRQVSGFCLPMPLRRLHHPIFPCSHPLRHWQFNWCVEVLRELKWLLCLCFDVPGMHELPLQRSWWFLPSQFVGTSHSQNGFAQHLKRALEL